MQVQLLVTFNVVSSFKGAVVSLSWMQKSILSGIQSYSAAVDHSLFPYYIPE